MKHNTENGIDQQISGRHKIEDFNVIKGCGSSVTLHERDINVNLFGYSHLNSGETDSIVLSYTVVDEFGLELPKLAYLFVEGTKTLPKLICSSFDIKTQTSSNIIMQAV